MSVNRRQLMAGAALTGAAATLPFQLTAARAAEGGDKAAQAPAFHRMSVGDVRVTGLADGHLTINASVFPETSEEEFAEAMRAAFMPGSAYTAPVNAYLVESGDRTVLIDAGGTAQMAPSLGKLEDNLAAAGVSPGDIDTILITHLHPDHIGGLTTDGAAAFPNAELVLRAEEANFWTDPATRAAMPEGRRGMVDAVTAALAAYEGRTTPFDSDVEVVPQVSAVFLPGHTPGHTGYRIASGDDALLIWGDIIHVAPLQMPDPRIFIGFDTDGAQAVETRLKLLDQLAADRTDVAGMHMAFPGFGNIARRGEGYEFVAIPWQY